MMTTPRLILLRFYNFSLGRIPVASYWLKKVLVYCLVKRAKEKYVASSKYFDCVKFKNERPEDKIVQ